MGERAMIPLQRKYRRAIELAEQADIDSPPEEHEGRLYFIGTVRPPPMSRKSGRPSGHSLIGMRR